MAYVTGDAFKELAARVMFQAHALPANYYLGLGTGALPASNATLASIAEVIGGGYSRKTLALNTTDFPTFLLDDDGFAKVTTLLKNFAATGAWTAADFAFLCDVSSGTSGYWYVAASLSVPFQHSGSDDTDVTFETQLG